MKILKITSIDLSDILLQYIKIHAHPWIFTEGPGLRGPRDPPESLLQDAVFDLVSNTNRLKTL